MEMPQVDLLAVILTMRDNGDIIGFLLYAYYTIITGWGGLRKKYHILFRIQA